jgi:4-carboxymuconolactone decarboxylase
VTNEPNERWARGLTMYRAVYGDEAVVFPAGQSPMFDVMIEQLFGEVWTRPALSIPTRRLLTLGVLAAQSRFEVIQLQLERTLDTGELTIEQVRETVIHLIAYVGYPSSGDLLRVSEAAIKAFEQKAGS